MKGFGTRTRFETEAKFNSEIGCHTNCLSSVCMYKTARRTFSCKIAGSHILNSLLCSHTLLSQYRCSTKVWPNTNIKHANEKNKTTLVSRPIFRVIHQSIVKRRHLRNFNCYKTLPCLFAIQNLIKTTIFKLMVLRNTLVHLLILIALLVFCFCFWPSFIGAGRVL